MKAQYYERYGRPEVVLELREMPRPVAGPGEVLVRVHATSVQALDWHLVLGEPRIMRQLLRIKLVSLLGGRRMTFGLARTTSADLEIMAE
ncbi:MAG: hypothetical protein L0Z63_11705, partial [Actinobacteria bacterium]|nr:hypothetical protein [Actinomycetota bacterium]